MCFFMYFGKFTLPQKKCLKFWAGSEIRYFMLITKVSLNRTVPTKLKRWDAPNLKRLAQILELGVKLGGQVVKSFPCTSADNLCCTQTPWWIGDRGGRLHIHTGFYIFSPNFTQQDLCNKEKSNLFRSIVGSSSAY